MANGSDDVPRGSLGTVRNATKLLRLLSEGPAYQQLTELADRSQMSLPTVHRLLRSLVLAGLVQQHPESSRYSLGPEVVRLSETYLARLPVCRSLAPYLVQLRDVTGATILIAVLVGTEVVYVDRVDGASADAFRVAHRVHAAAETAAGRLLLAHAPQTQWDDAMTGAPTTLSSDVRERWAAEQFQVLAPDDPHGEVEVAVPVCDERGTVLAALVASGGAEQFPHDRLISTIVPQLRRAARSATTSSHG